jgi:hypothetical protein
MKQSKIENGRPTLQQHNVMRSALAEQHKKTRYDAIDEVNNTSLYFEQRQNEGKLCFWEIMREMESLKRKIMNLRNRSLVK